MGIRGAGVRCAGAATLAALVLSACSGSGSAASPTSATTTRAAEPAPSDTDRAALAQRLRDAGLTADHARHLADDVAQVGLELQLSAARPGVTASRLGGPGLLPAGMRWPRRGVRGRPLSFLGAIDLAEVRAAGGDARLPRTGTLLFYADIDNGEAEGLVDASGNGPLSPARALYVPQRTALRRATAPAAIVHGDHLVLRRRWVRFRARLTLSDAFDAAKLVGLAGDEAKAYDTIAAQLVAGDGLDGPLPHWVGGLATGAQGYPDPDDSIDLLQITSDERLAFDYLDVGVIQFRISTAALRHRKWSAIHVDADSA